MLFAFVVVAATAVVVVVAANVGVYSRYSARPTSLECAERTFALFLMPPPLLLSHSHDQPCDWSYFPFLLFCLFYSQSQPPCFNLNTPQHFILSSEKCDGGCAIFPFVTPPPPPCPLSPSSHTHAHWSYCMINPDYCVICDVLFRQPTVKKEGERKRGRSKRSTSNSTINSTYGSTPLLWLSRVDIFPLKKIENMMLSCVLYFYISKICIFICFSCFFSVENPCFSAKVKKRRYPLFFFFYSPLLEQAETETETEAEYNISRCLCYLFLLLLFLLLPLLFLLLRLLLY